MHSDKKSYPRPVMAVLVRSKSISRLQKQMAAPRIRLLAESNKEVNNILYFFSLSGVKLKEQKITGYYWHKTKNRWLHHDFSFPDVLYIRFGFDKGYNQTLTELCNMITKKNGELITHHRFNKWRLYQIISKDPVLKNYLPVTRTVKKPDDIKKMLKRYKVVYLKSHIGRKGENVLRVDVLPDSSYRYSYYRHEQLTVRTVSDFQALMNVVNKFFHGKKFLIQQGIQLMKFKNRLIDLRAELQRNGDGDLEIVGISVRHGRHGSPITTHGDAYRFDDFFGKNMGLSTEQLETFRSAVQKFLFSVYEYIDKNYGKYAEIGIDFAIDVNKKIWFIEANSQSTHVSLSKAYGKAAFYRYNKNILEYARQLSNRSKRGVKSEQPS
ncbi:MAG: YheC/YheD family protein [Dethiobacter sp.]|nr:YheC/YheD family protein [Dethiobacter sp.]